MTFSIFNFQFPQKTGYTYDLVLLHTPLLGVDDLTTPSPFTDMSSTNMCFVFDAFPYPPPIPFFLFIDYLSK